MDTQGVIAMIRIVTVRGIEMEVNFNKHPFRPGAREKGGLQLEPDEPAGVEIVYIRCFKNTDVQRIMQAFLNEEDLLLSVEEHLWQLLHDDDLCY